ncbi:MAG: hypothetical protein JWM73_1839 [Solirubrobacterales bacterium]|nr:hypothetical protein [Solirubrobacterales bacterium]
MLRGSLLAAVFALLAAAPAAHAGAVGLHLRADTGPGTTVRTATLRCDSKGPRATGYLRRRDAAKLCRRAYRLEAFLGRPPRRDRPCTEIYGGPDRVTVEGFVRGTGVQRRFSRADGCEIADWNRAARLLPRASAA